MSPKHRANGALYALRVTANTNLVNSYSYGEA